MIMSALGVPREVIFKDYLLSTGYRKPLYELPKIDPVAQADNPAAMFFVKYQQSPEAAKPKPLVDGQNRSEEHTSELQSLMRISYAVFCLKKTNTERNNKQSQHKPKRTHDNDIPNSHNKRQHNTEPTQQGK